ncbi:Gp42 [Mycolicibacterium canariasense]|uniref:Gp42 n=1 Tax=Mycolicibacterium canariasense TaxID=228230 RepID=A0A100WJ64_MYCCR|nr:DUF3263 domain-containing protein [Mycolicibacterium canariasense]MCV7210214.1 DUF3263 domain-containing protein [Mycolicibacterium canariasense]GAS98874.1 Gp42 [Mycolicibacterium canariasense]
MDPLTDTDRAILDLEHQWWPTAGAKEDAVRALGLSPVRYYRRLNQLIDSESALTYDAVVVNRLRRIAGREDR